MEIRPKVSNVLITRGSGYFGSLLVRKLLATAHYCTVFDVSGDDDRSRNVKFIQADIRSFGGGALLSWR
jgi:nucleoside-diphosphate-sugar epimerase